MSSASGALPSNNFEPAAIPFEVEYKNVKTLRITVYPPDGRVRITAPPGTAREYIRKFAETKIRWIEKHRGRFVNHSKLNGSLRNNSTVYLWGKTLKLELAERRGNPKILIEGDIMKMYVRPDYTKAKRQDFLDRWYRRALKETAPPIIKKWEAVMRVEVTGLFVRKMKTHWGSCNCEKRTLRLNSELVKRSPECLEYVIVHEMLHIIEKGHNSNFYRLLTKYMPGWKAIRKRMNIGEL
jgi:predicted metal-dependent hydrolase